jgi:hypothetical protein
VTVARLHNDAEPTPRAGLKVVSFVPMKGLCTRQMDSTYMKPPASFSTRVRSAGHDTVWQCRLIPDPVSAHSPFPGSIGMTRSVKTVTG